MKRLIAKILSAAMVLSVMPSVAMAEYTEPQYTVYEQNFESETVESDIKAGENGWGTGAANNAESYINVWVGENGSEGNSLRFASSDWYKNIWTTLDFEANGVCVREERGQENTQDTVKAYLSDDLSLAFKIKFELQGKDSNGGHEQYVRIKSAENNVIAEIGVKDDKLSVVALNAAGTANEAYEIKTIDNSNGTTEWHDFKIDLDFTENKYRMTIDGEVFDDTSYGEWIPAGTSAGAGTASQAAAIGQLGSMELGFFWSGWWHCAYVDDITIMNNDASAQLPAEATPEPTAEPTEAPTLAPDATPTPTPEPTPEPTPIPEPTAEPTMDPAIKYYEDFEEAGLENEVKSQSNGWGYDGSSDVQDKNINIWIGDNSTGSKSLRFASDSIWYRDIWLTLNLKENALYKAVTAGKDSVTAEAEIDEYLSGYAKLSFDARFGNSGRSDNLSDMHEQYIRIKGSDNHNLAEIRVYEMPKGSTESDTVYLKLPNDEMFEICKIKTDDGQYEWHNFAFYFDPDRNAFMLEVDGEVFKDTTYGKWVPAMNESSVDTPIDYIMSMELGHHWTSWWQDICIDNLTIAEYEPIAAEYEINSIKITNEHGGTSFTPGNKYNATVNATGAETKETQLTWTYSTDGGVTWLPLETEIIPAEETNIKVSVVCTSADGKVITGEEAVAVSQTGTVDFVDIIREEFEGTDKEAEIIEQRNGWKISGSSNQVDIGTGFGGGTRNTLRFASTASNVTNNLRLDFEERGASFNENDRLYLKFDFTFGLGSDDDTLNSAAVAYVRIKDTNNKAFAGVTLQGSTMYMTYYDAEAQKNKQYVIAKGDENVLDIWRTLELYLDTTTNEFCMLLDGEAVGPDGMKWFTPADTIVPGIGKPSTVTGIGAVDIGQENSAWWENTCIDNIVLQRYYLPAGNTFAINSLDVYNEFDNSLDIVTGSKVAAEVTPDSGSTVAEAIYTWEYFDGEWKAMADDTVPTDAEKVRVKGQFRDVYGQSLEMTSEEIAVVKNSVPSITDLKVSGSIASGSILTPSYTFTDADGDSDNSILIWSQTRQEGAEFKEISRDKEYTVAEKDEGSCIKLTIIPCDSKGAYGESVEYEITSGENSVFTTVWNKISIPTTPTSSSITLPTSFDEYGVTIKWASSDSSVVSTSGKITKPSSGSKTVTLTATATDSEGNTDRRIFVLTIKAASSSSSGGSGGGGSSSGSSYSGSAGSTALIPHATAAPVLPYEGGEGSHDSGKKYFNDVLGTEWFAANVFELKDKGIINGDENGNFNPNNAVTRAEFVTMIVGLLDIKDNTAVCDFGDVAEDSWYYTYVASAVKFNIVSGMGNGMFGANEYITRQDIAVIAANAMEMIKETDANGDLSEFADADSISEYAVESVKAMRNDNVMAGSDGLFRPKDNATRAEAARVIYVISEYLI